MARTVKGCPTPRPQKECATEHEQDPQLEEQKDATEGKVIVDNDLDNPKSSKMFKKKGRLILMQNM